MKLKNRINNRLNRIKIILDTNQKRTILILILFLALYMTTCYHNHNYIDAFISTLNFTYFLIIYFMIILYANLKIKNYYEKDNNYIIRLNDKDKYIKEIIENSLIIGTIIFFITILMLMIGFNIICHNNIATTTIKGIPIIMYLIYSIIKFYILQSIVIAYTELLFLILPNKLVLLLSILFYLISFYPSNLTYILTDIKIFGLKIWITNYFLSYNFFKDFLSEIFNLISFIILTLALLKICMRKIINKVGDVI